MSNQIQNAAVPAYATFVRELLRAAPALASCLAPEEDQPQGFVKLVSPTGHKIHIGRGTTKVTYVDTTMPVAEGQSHPVSGCIPVSTNGKVQARVPASVQLIAERLVPLFLDPSVPHKATVRGASGKASVPMKRATVSDLLADLSAATETASRLMSQETSGSDHDDGYYEEPAAWDKVGTSIE